MAVVQPALFGAAYERSDRAVAQLGGWLLALPYPARNVLRRWRSLLGMVVGVGIALGLGMTMLAMAQGSINLDTADYKVSGADLYVIQRGGTLVPVLPSDTPGAVKSARGVLAQIRGTPGVRSALAVMTWSMEREREGPRRRDEPAELFAAMGVDGDPTLIPGALLLKEGRWLRRADEVVLGAKVSREKGLPPGATLRLNGRDFTVVGVGRLRGFGFGGDGMALMDYRAFRERSNVGDVVSIIAVDTVQPEVLREQLPDIGALVAFDRPQLVQLAEQVNASSVVTMWVLIVMTLAIAALFVANMLGRSVAERRLEFATLRAIGVPARTILLTVGAEAALVCVTASLIGILISLFLGFLIDALLAPSVGVESFYAADAALFAMVFLLASGLGLVSGIMPARQAIRVDPVDVLREA